MTLSSWLLLAWVSASPAGPVGYLLTRPEQASLQFTIQTPLDPIRGTAHGLMGAAVFDPATGAAHGRLVLDLAAFRTGVDMRDRALRERFFDVRHHPRAVLEIERVDWSHVPQAGTPGAGVAVGILTMHGVSRPLSVPVQAALDDVDGRPGLSLHAELWVAFADYDIWRPRPLLLSLGDAALVTVDASFTRSELRPPPPVAPPPPAPVMVQISEVTTKVVPAPSRRLRCRARLARPVASRDDVCLRTKGRRSAACAPKTWRKANARVAR